MENFQPAPAKDYQHCGEGFCEGHDGITKRHSIADIYSPTVKHKLT